MTISGRDSGTLTEEILHRLSLDRTKMMNGDFAGAISDYTTATSLGICYTKENHFFLCEAIKNRAFAKSLLGDYKEALKDFHEFARFQYRDDTARVISHNNLAMIYRIIDNKEMAECNIRLNKNHETRVYTDAIKKALSKDYILYANLEMKKEKPNIKAALIYCEEALRLQNNDPDVQQCHAQILKMKNLIEAIKENDSAAFYKRLNENPSSIHSLDELGEGDALHWAVALGHVHFIDPLVKAGADINKKVGKYGEPPIGVAAGCGQVEMIAVLKAKGANVDAPNKNGSTPIFLAAWIGQADAIRALKAAGATTVDTPNNYGLTPMLIAASNGNAEAITALKEAGASVNTPTSLGVTPLHIAVEVRSTDALIALIRAGAKVDDPCPPDGRTALFLAVENGNVEAVKALLDAKADINVTTNGSILGIAQQSEDPRSKEIIELLLKQYKSDISSTARILRVAKSDHSQDVKVDSILNLLEQAKSCASTETDRCLTFVTKASKHPDATVDDLLSCCELYASKGDLPAAKSLYYRMRDKASSLEQLERCEKLCEQFKDYRAMAANAVKLLQLRKSLLSQTIQPTRTLFNK